MNRFMALTFLLLGWGFYEASGGEEFGGPAEASRGLPVVVASLDEVPQEDMADVVGVAAAASYAATEPSPPMPVQVVARAYMDFDAPLAPVREVVPPAAEPAAPPPTIDLREVSGTRVNMRAGPGTEHGIVTVLSRGARTEVLETKDGWARIRAEDGTTGWMSARLLSAI